MVEAWPLWFVKLGRRVAALPRGRLHTLVIVMPHDGDPQWALTQDAKLEGCEHISKI